MQMPAKLCQLAQGQVFGGRQLGRLLRLGRALSLGGCSRLLQVAHPARLRTLQVSRKLQAHEARPSR